jgi:hypothetical protein
MIFQSFWYRTLDHFGFSMCIFILNFVFYIFVSTIHRNSTATRIPRGIPLESVGRNPRKCAKPNRKGKQKGDQRLCLAFAILAHKRHRLVAKNKILEGRQVGRSNSLSLSLSLYIYIYIYKYIHIYNRSSKFHCHAQSSGNPLRKRGKESSEMRQTKTNKGDQQEND